MLICFAALLLSCSSHRVYIEPEKEYVYEAPHAKETLLWEQLSSERITEEFEKRKGKFLMPVLDNCSITCHFGLYDFPGEKNVQLDQKGVKILCSFNNVNACSIFYGIVSAVFQYNDQYGILIRHGSYISGYFGLYTVGVQKGEYVVPRQAIGQIITNHDGKAVLQFQLRHETQTLDPELWINNK